ncbi:MAG: hypothetical protein ABWX96_21345 [Propionibacteriaceae bacterium]
MSHSTAMNAAFDYRLTIALPVLLPLVEFLLLTDTLDDTGTSFAVTPHIPGMRHLWLTETSCRSIMTNNTLTARLFGEDGLNRLGYTSRDLCAVCGHSHHEMAPCLPPDTPNTPDAPEDGQG